MLEAFLNEQVKIVCKKYKIDEISARTYISENLDKNKELFILIKSNDKLKDIYKTRLYKEFIKKIKKEIYFGLRTYQVNEDTTANSHVSTKERAPYLEKFIEQLDEILNSSESILDLGGGMFPATFPFEKYPNLKTFVWLDKDGISYEKLKSLKEETTLEKLHLLNENIEDSTWDDILYTACVPSFDLVLMLKLIPVVNRQEKHLLSYIARVPAKYVFVSGSKEALVKKQSIEHREDQVINRFIKLTGRKIIKRIDIGNEFGYLIS